MQQVWHKWHPMQLPRTRSDPPRRLFARANIQRDRNYTETAMFVQQVYIIIIVWGRMPINFMQINFTANTHKVSGCRLKDKVKVAQANHSLVQPDPRRKREGLVACMLQCTTLQFLLRVRSNAYGFRIFSQKVAFEYRINTGPLACSTHTQVLRDNQWAHTHSTHWKNFTTQANLSFLSLRNYSSLADSNISLRWYNLTENITLVTLPLFSQNGLTLSTKHCEARNTHTFRTFSVRFSTNNQRCTKMSPKH